MVKIAEAEKTLKGLSRGAEKLFNAWICLRMPLWLDTKGNARFNTVQYRSEVPAQFKSCVCRHSTYNPLNLGRTPSREQDRRDRHRNFSSGPTCAACSNLRIGAAGPL